MGIGVISIQTSQKRRQTGPPFAANSAENGLSVDATNDRIVLGNNVGDVAAPARLLNDREIVTSNAVMSLAIILNNLLNSITTALNGASVIITGANFTNPFLNIICGTFGSAALTLNAGASSLSALSVLSGLNGQSTIRIATNTDEFIITTDGNGHIVFSTGGINIWQINTATFFTQIGPTLATDNGATLQVTGTLTNRVFTQSQGAGTYNVNRDLDSNKLFRNSAAANLALPNMAAANLRAGFTIGVNCFNAAGITVTADAGQTIRFGSLSTSSGGTISSTDVGAYMRITLLDAATWITESFNGAWVLT